MTQASKPKSAVNTNQTSVETEPQSATERENLELDSQVDEIEEIRRAAYARYEARQFGNGDPAQDWLEAEAEVLARRSQTIGM